MNRKKYLTESMISDLGEQIVNNVYQILMDYGYEQHEIDNIVTRDSIELDINNNECVLYCGNDIIFKTPGNILIHKFVTEAEDHLLQWCINKIGRKPNYLDANELFGDVPGWNNLNEAYGTDFEDTLAWVQNKFPNKSEKEQHQFAKNIMKRYVAPVETNSTDVVEKPKTRKNVKLIKIVDIPNHGRHQDVYCKSLLLRTARKPGDTERVNHTVLGRLNAAGVKYEIIDENINKNMGKKNTIKLTESEIKKVISESVKQIISEVSWQTRINAANKARQQVRDRIYQLGAGEIDPNGYYSKISGQYGPYTGREWKKGRKGYTTSRQELERRLKQADNLSKYADEGIKQEFGPMSYYNDANGVGKEYPALRRFYNNREIGEKDIVDYYPNKDYVSGEYDDYNLEDMPQGFQRKAKEVNDFQNGNYQYTKGKGWHLKDNE